MGLVAAVKNAVGNGGALPMSDSLFPVRISERPELVFTPLSTYSMLFQIRVLSGLVSK